MRNCRRCARGASQGPNKIPAPGFPPSKAHSIIDPPLCSQWWAAPTSSSSTDALMLRLDRISRNTGAENCPEFPLQAVSGLMLPHCARGERNASRKLCTVQELRNRTSRHYGADMLEGRASMKAPHTPHRSDARPDSGHRVDYRVNALGVSLLTEALYKSQRNAPGSHPSLALLQTAATPPHQPRIAGAAGSSRSAW